MKDINIKKVQYLILGVFIATFGLLIWFLNSNYKIKKDYLKFNKLEFKTTVLSKFDEHSVRGNKIYLKNGHELIIQRELFDNIKIGDSIIKKIDSDSVYFYSAKGVIIDDYNKHQRNKYFNSLEN